MANAFWFPHWSAGVATNRCLHLGEFEHFLLQDSSIRLLEREAGLTFCFAYLLSRVL